MVRRHPEAPARDYEDGGQKVSPTDLGFTRGRITSAQVGDSRLAMARAKRREHIRRNEGMEERKHLHELGFTRVRHY